MYLYHWVRATFIVSWFLFILNFEKNNEIINEVAPYRETIDIDDNSITSPDSFHSIEDDKETDGNQFTQDDMILSGSIVNLNKQ